MESWEITLDLDGKWHCYHIISFQGHSRVLMWTNLKAIKAQVRYIVEAPDRNRALSIAKRDWRGEQNLKEKYLNINSALPISKERGLDKV